ncbi:hypothetical protein [Hymenobacter sp. IS2118]|uniref:hypothetical protein n=1 Tax=Hymenobacter sp. IS2118 TaxID=1505605 RepID=UPI0005566F16|nr:hypothetical protein [Hymenobacter sp. IS2118]
MTFDKSMLRTILFSVGVAALVIGIYQTLLFNSIADNYWIFMVAMACWFPLLYWRQQERLAAKVAEEEAKLAKKNQTKTPAKSNRKRR